MLVSISELQIHKYNRTQESLTLLVEEGGEDLSSTLHSIFVLRVYDKIAFLSKLNLCLKEDHNNG